MPASTAMWTRKQCRQAWDAMPVKAGTQPFKAKVWEGFMPADGPEEPFNPEKPLDGRVISIFNGKSFKRTNGAHRLIDIMLGSSPGVVPKRKPSIDPPEGDYKHMRPEYDAFITELELERAAQLADPTRKAGKRKSSPSKPTSATPSDGGGSGGASDGGAAAAAAAAITVPTEPTLPPQRKSKKPKTQTFMGAGSKLHTSGPPWSGADVRNALVNKQYVYGTCCTSTSPKMPDALCSSGIGVVFIDTEHVPIVRDTMSWMCQAFNSRGVPPLVRVPEPEPYRVTEYLDAGAKGIVAPYIETVAQAKMLVGATKLRPLKGELLQHILDNLRPIDPSAYTAGGPRTTELLYGQVEKILAKRGDPAPQKTTAFMKKKNSDNFLLLNIESVAAVSNLEKLAAIPGVDGFLVGPHDLSCNFGVPEEWGSATFHNAIGRVIEVAEEFNIGSGIHYSFDKDVEFQAKWGRAGARLVMHSTDTKHVASRVRDEIVRIGAANGDPNPPSGAGLDEVEGV